MNRRPGHRAPVAGTNYERCSHAQGIIELGSADADGVAEHLRCAQGARFLDVLASDPAAAHDDVDLVLLGQLFEGLGVLPLRLCTSRPARPGWSRRENRRIS